MLLLSTPSKPPLSNLFDVTFLFFMSRSLNVTSNACLYLSKIIPLSIMRWIIFNTKIKYKLYKKVTVIYKNNVTK